MGSRSSSRASVNSSRDKSNYWKISGVPRFAYARTASSKLVLPTPLSPAIRFTCPNLFIERFWMPRKLLIDKSGKCKPLVWIFDMLMILNDQVILWSVRDWLCRVMFIQRRLLLIHGYRLTFRSQRQDLLEYSRLTPLMRRYSCQLLTMFSKIWKLHTYLY